jgi:hypothetical protein
MSGNWYIAVVKSGLASGGFATGQRVAFRKTVEGLYECIGHGSVTAILSEKAAKLALECVRVGRDWRPLVARGQARLSIRWCECREARKFGRAA